MKKYAHGLAALFFIFPFCSLGSGDHVEETFIGNTESVSYYFKAQRLTPRVLSELEEIKKPQDDQFQKSHTEAVLARQHKVKYLRETFQETLSHEDLLKLFRSGRSDLDSGLLARMEEISGVSEAITTIERIEKEAQVLHNSRIVLDELMHHAKRWSALAKDSWIISAVRKSDGIPLMRMNAISSEKSQIVHHIGICQTYEHLTSWREGDRPKGLSLQLHGFSAYFMRQRNPECSFMITQPRAVMLKILKEEFKESLLKVEVELLSHKIFTILDKELKKITAIEADEWLTSLQFQQELIGLSLAEMASRLEGMTSIAPLGLDGK